MRDLLVLAIFAIGVLYAIRDPFIGVIVYYWISVMNPHRYAWGFAREFPLALIAALATMLGIALRWNEVQLPRNREFYAFLLLWGFMTITTVFAFYPDDAWVVWKLISKTFLMTLAAMMLLTTRQRVIYFLLALVAFVGFVAVKGAVFGVLTGGRYMVWGPPDSFLADNNALGLATVMVLPICFQLRELTRKKWQSRAMLVVGVCLIISTVLTYSRGALVGLLTVGIFYFVVSKQKVRVLLVGTFLVVVALNVLPSTWFDRMNTIKTYEEDGSANMRLNSWTMSWNLAKDNPLGGGFDCFRLEQYHRYSPNPELGKAGGRGGVGGSTAHSLYFEVIATQGFGGFTIYMAALGFMLLTLMRINRNARAAPDEEWLSSVSRGLLVSILGFMSCGAFQSKAFFDMFWAIYACGVGLAYVVDSGAWVEGAQTAPAPARVAPVPLRQVRSSHR